MKSTEIEIMASVAIIEAQKNNYTEEQRALALFYNKVQDSCSQLLKITEYNKVGTAYLLMANNSFFMDNEDIRRVIANNAFYCISKAIEKEITNENLRIKRLLVLNKFHNDFYYTIANALNISDNGFNDMFSLAGGIPLIVRTNDYYYSIIKHDFSNVRQEQFRGIESLQGLYQTLNNRMGDYTSQKGKDYIDKIVKYLEREYSKY